MIPLHPPANDTPPIIETPIVVARHRGRCAGELCRQPIRIDEEIQRVDRSWHHTECVPVGAVERYALRREAA